MSIVARFLTVLCLLVAVLAVAAAPLPDGPEAQAQPVANAAEAAVVAESANEKVDDRVAVGPNAEVTPEAVPEVVGAPNTPPPALADQAQAPLTLPLQWTTQFGDHIEGGSTIELSWTGGDSTWGYEAYYVPQWPQQRNYDIVPIANTTEGHWTWNVPSLSAYPDGTTFILGIKDGSEGPGGDWYDLSRALKLV